VTDAIFDLADLAEEVTIGRRTFQVRGISFRSWVSLASRFPVVRDLLSGQSVGWESIATVAPDIVMAILAAGCGEDGNAKTEAFFDGLPLPTQYDLGERIWRLSFPDGFGPFVERFQRFASAVGVDPRGPLAVSPASSSG
jgi:hypothetical protein